MGVRVTLGRVAGIPLRLHSSFLLLGGLVIFVQLVNGGLTSALAAALLALAIFGSVLLHELGHALMARFYGIQTRDITLYPFGGIAALAGEPRSARQEFWIAVAGPMVNLGLFALLAPLAVLGVPGALPMAAVNLGMAVFNLLPAFPMDGGRVLRSLLAPRFGYYGASDRALRLGRAFAWLFVVGGLFVSPSLVLVGGFLLFATWQERRRLTWMARHRVEPWKVARASERLVRFVDHPLFRHPVAS